MSRNPYFVSFVTCGFLWIFIIKPWHRNGGTCLTSIDGFQCHCRLQWAGRHCQKRVAVNTPGRRSNCTVYTLQPVNSTCPSRPSTLNNFSLIKLVQVPRNIKLILQHLHPTNPRPRLMQLILNHSAYLSKLI